jgi:hypothetical protein
MTALEFRRRHRAYGERVPHDQISVALASGYRLADAAEEMVGPTCADGSAIMIPPTMELAPCAE